MDLHTVHVCILTSPLLPPESGSLLIANVLVEQLWWRQSSAAGGMDVIRVLVCVKEIEKELIVRYHTCVY